MSFSGVLDIGSDVQSARGKNHLKLDQLVTDELNRLTLDNLELRSKNKESEISVESFRNDDEKVKYYTGLPSFHMLMVVYRMLQNYIIDSNWSTLSKFQKLVLVLMTLRLNIPVHDLAYRFDVSDNCV